MNALQFQEKAIEELLSSFKSLCKPQGTGHPDTPVIILKAPTGSGKTFITESFLNRLVFQSDGGEDIAFIWMTCSETLALQSRDKFREYFSPNVASRLLTADDIDQNEMLLRNDILFSNWQKYNISREKFDKRTLRRPDDERKLKESGWYFDDMVENTRKAGRRIALIIDESHAYDSKLAQESVIKEIAPCLIIKISATPFKSGAEEDKFYGDVHRRKAAMVEVDRADVIAEGLIKEAVITQTEEDILGYTVKDEDIEKLLLSLAKKKQEEIREEWSRLGYSINPLVMIQLPNDSKTKASNEIESKRIRVLQILNELGVDESRIATRLQETSERMESITAPDSSIDFLLFKLAAATGWDCPRAHILVRYREIKSESFEVQTLGRILRMPVVKKDFANTLLRTGYLYTNFPRSSVHVPDETAANRPKVLHTQLDAEAKKSFVRSAAADIFGSLFDSIGNSGTSSTKDEIQSAAAPVLAKLKDEYDNAVYKIDFVPFSVQPGTEEHKAKTAQVTEKIESLKETVHTAVVRLVKVFSENKGIASEQKSELENDIRTKLSQLVQKTEDVALGEKETEIVLDSCLKSDFLSRADYGDLGKVSEFRKHFVASMNTFFGIDGNMTYTPGDLNKKLEAKGLVLDRSMKQKLVVDARYESENTLENEDNGKEIDYEISHSNVVLAFTEKCYEILSGQTEDDAKVGNIARSFGPFRQTLVLWLKNYALPHMDYLEAYKIFLNDCDKAKVIMAAITQSLKEYRGVLDAYVTGRENASSVSVPFTIKTHYSYTDEYAEFGPAEKSFVKPFYLRKDYHGRDNETEFIKYMEASPNVLRWFKNGDSGKEFLSFKYFDSTEGRNRLFYPDWLVELDDGRICILDTKGGNTASSTETKEKAGELQRRIAGLNACSSRQYIGGIVIRANGGQWYIQNESHYRYSMGDLSANGWKTLAWKEL